MCAPSIDADQLVELELDRLGVAVLRVLDQEHHQERDDRRAGVDDQLPGVAEAEERPGDEPSRTTAAATSMNAAGLPVARAVHFANRVKEERDLVGFMVPSGEPFSGLEIASQMSCRTRA